MAAEIPTSNPLMLTYGKPLWDKDEHRLHLLVRDAIEALPEKNRAVVEMRLYGRYTFQEIADTLGWEQKYARQTAWMYWSRGLEKIRRYILEREPSLDD